MMNQQSSLMSAFMNAHHNEEQQQQHQAQNDVFKFNNNFQQKPWDGMMSFGMQSKTNSNYGQDSLLGMAASLFNNNGNNGSTRMGNNNNNMGLNPFQGMGLNTQSEQPTRPEDIMNQVLSELSDDLFDPPAASDDLFDMEPVPINEQRMNGNNDSARLAFLEDTLNQVLDGVGDMDDFGLPSAPISTNKRSQDISDLDFLTSMMPPTKKPCVMMSSPAVAPQAAPSAVSIPSMEENAEDDEDAKNRFRPYQAEQWSEKYEELLEFKKQRGHCCVPHTFQENPSLARWVKRQRYQYKLKNEGKPSTMTDERVVALESVGFVWDSHGAAWEERWNELSDYRKVTGHTNVPSNHPENPQLATWVKCQRRQYKLFWDGKPSNMTLERITKLEQLGFEWELRGSSKNKGGPLML